MPVGPLAPSKSAPKQRAIVPEMQLSGAAAYPKTELPLPLHLAKAPLHTAKRQAAPAKAELPLPRSGKAPPTSPKVAAKAPPTSPKVASKAKTMPLRHNLTLKTNPKKGADGLAKSESQTQKNSRSNLYLRVFENLVAFHSYQQDDDSVLAAQYYVSEVNLVLEDDVPAKAELAMLLRDHDWFNKDGKLSLMMDTDTHFMEAVQRSEARLWRI